MSLGLFPELDEKETRKSVSKFLTKDLERLLLMSGHDLLDLKSPVLSAAPGILSGDGYFGDQANVQYKEINRMIESFKDLWDCVEKVNAHLVVEE